MWSMEWRTRCLEMRHEGCEVPSLFKPRSVKQVAHDYIRAVQAVKRTRGTGAGREKKCRRGLDM